MNSIRINYFTRSDAEFQIAADIRTAVFTREQGADELGEFDCYDETALFALLYIDSKPAGTAIEGSPHDEQSTPLRCC